LLLKNRLEIAQQQNIMLIRHAQANGLPIPLLKASNPLPNRRLVVIASSPSTHEYGITFDSIVPASPTAAPHIEKEMIEVPKPESRGSTTTVQSSNASVVTVKEEKKGFRLSIFKGVFSKTSKPKKSEPSPPPPGPVSIPITVTRSENVPVPNTSPTSESSRPNRRQTVTTSRPRKPETFQFSMQPVASRLDSNKGIKERPTPSMKTIEKYINPGPIPLPRYAKDLIRSLPATALSLQPSEDSKWRYAGRALAEWDIIVKQCDAYVDSILYRRESIPEEVNEDESIYMSTSITSSSPLTVSAPIIKNLHIPRMTVELPKFYFTGKSNRDT
jgi:hypothetical protein